MSEHQEPASEADVRVVLVGRSDALDRLGRTLSADMDVHSVSTPEEAVEASHRADCLVSDETHVSALRDRVDLPILSLTADSDGEMAAGATDVILADADRALATARVRNVVDASASTARPTARTEALLEACTAVVALTTPSGRIDWVNDAVDRTLDYTPETLRNEPLASIVTDGDRQTVAAHRQAVAESSLDATESFTARVRHGSGRTERVRIDVRNRLADPELNGLVWTVVPVTETDPADVDGTSIDRLDDPVVTLDDDRIVTAANDAATRRFVRNGDSPIGFEFWELVPGETLDTWYEGIAEAAARGSTGSFVVDAPPTDGIDVVTVYPAETGLTLVVQRRDESIADRHRADLERTAGLLDVVPGPAFLVDDGTISMANRATIEYAADDSVVGRSLASVVGDRLAATIRDRARASIRRVDPLEWRPTVGGEERTVALTVDAIDDRIAVVGRDETGRRRLADAATTLSDSIDALRSASSVQSTRRRALRTLASTFDASAGVWYRRTDDRLTPVATVGTPAESVPTLSLDPETVSSILEEPTRLEPTERIPISADTVIENPIALAISADDVLVVGSSRSSPTETGIEPSGDRRDVDVDDATALPDFDAGATGDSAMGSDSSLAVLGPVVGSVVRIARTLAACRAETRELETTLRSEERRRARTTAVIDRYDVLADVVRTAATRRVLERRVCETVRELDAIDAVVVLSGADPMRVRARAGSLPSAIAPVADDRHRSDDQDDDAGRVLGPLTEPVRRAIDSGEQVVESVDFRGYDGPERADSTVDGGAVIVTPLEGRTHQEGALLVFTDAVTDRELYERLGRQVATITALGIDAIETQRALLAEDTVELELAMDVSGDDALAELASTVSSRVDLDAVVPGADRFTCYVTVRGDVDADPSALVDRIRPLTRIDRLRETDTGTRLELVVDGHPYIEAVAAHGGVVSSVEIRDEEIAVRIELPTDRDVRAVVEAVRSNVPSTKLAARRPTTHAGGENPSVSSLLDSLTDRQRQILRTAHAAGYFEWPRERTGEEIAARLDISQPTFTRHFRAAERRIFDRLFDADSS